MNENQKLIAAFVKRGSISFSRPLTEEEIDAIYVKQKARDKESRQKRKPRRICPFPQIAHLKGNDYKREYAKLRRKAFQEQGLTSAGEPRVRK